MSGTARNNGEVGMFASQNLAIRVGAVLGAQAKVPATRNLQSISDGMGENKRRSDHDHHFLCEGYFLIYSIRNILG